MKWSHFPSMTMNNARVLAGAGMFILTLIVLAMIAWKPEIADNDLFKSIAQAIIIQGLIGLVLAFSFTGKNPNEDEPGGPRQVEVVNRRDHPVPVEDDLEMMDDDEMDQWSSLGNDQ